MLRGLNEAGAGFSAGTQAVLRGLDRPELFKGAIIGVLGHVHRSDRGALHPGGGSGPGPTHAGDSAARRGQWPRRCWKASPPARRSAGRRWRPPPTRSSNARTANCRWAPAPVDARRREGPGCSSRPARQPVARRQRGRRDAGNRPRSCGVLIRTSPWPRWPVNWLDRDGLSGTAVRRPAATTRSRACSSARRRSVLWKNRAAESQRKRLPT